MKIKICGIKTISEAKSVCECEFDGVRVDFIGLIFADSKRKVSVETARNIANLARKFGVKAVGVFSGIKFDEIASIVEFANLDVVQIYEKVEDKTKFGCEVWQVFSVGDSLPSFEGSYDKILFDTKGASKGGNGVKFDWDLLQGLDARFGLAGGIGVENLKDAMKLKPSFVDINSRIENEFGFKDIKKVYEILKIVSLGDLK
ncbi:phosphoribosylanthranilate isomerase [Campylobacter hyointestinalis subsp. hyointestinalis]|uniref:phosphoribosylanthranilate isomerase n=1 Tax=Campylobacter hyointestinalis TaxID=198 RepID=UPI000CE35067|nr:phosphoribosylanthranilate isomerase [Campylobacter hyointestinalis]PPB57331.1 N-(5'-phosphoribosyl)anthranilate isomerase [Campylobacter hyointestinalis subsp. hyointestinalis]PPB62464.1 N-(5'-phosphoribosyl)anthranilate isomerase [Campylobacter hyointestinalis subsp. hyointestinalis]PPB64146.1 N-(5'-phosphoribosyl)anthranilate isomerase [Campylobacter hyointestinalis subsp. hyointestinalis]QCU00445.1 phosphoribosylanthranilate isomerase [Campylobacter hyointestinalis subsp. hyointestinalis